MMQNRHLSSWLAMSVVAVVAMSCQRTTEPRSAAGTEFETDDKDAPSLSTADDWPKDWVHASQQNEYERLFSIIVGIDDYSVEATELEPLQFAVNDALAIQDVLEADFGFLRTYQRVLVDRQATREALIDTLQRWLPEQKLTARDAILVFFAGHGAIDRKDDSGYLAAFDSKRDALTETWISVSFVRDMLRNLECGHKLVILDSCYSGSLFHQTSFPQSVAVTSSQPLHLKDRQQRGVGDVSEYDTLTHYFTARAFLGMSAGRHTPVADGLGDKRHSVFTAALLQVLHDRADSPRDDGIFTFRQLAAQVETRVANALGSRQIPDWGRLGPGDGDFVFSPTVRRLTQRERAASRTAHEKFLRALVHLEQGAEERGLHLLARSLSLAPPSDAELQAVLRQFIGAAISRRRGTRTVYTGHSQVQDVIFSANGNYMAVRDRENGVQLWSMRNAAPIGPLLQHDQIVLAVAVANDGRTLLTGMADNTAKLWSITNDAATSIALPHDAAVREVAISSNGNFIATCAGNTMQSNRLSVSVWDGKSGEIRHQADKVRWTTVDYFAFTPDEQLLIWASRNPLQGAPKGFQELVAELTTNDENNRELSEIVIFDLAESRTITRHPHTSNVRTLCISPDSQKLAIGYNDKSAELRHSRNGALIGTPVMHDGAVELAQFSADGASLITASDKSVFIWNVMRGSTVNISSMTTSRELMTAGFIKTDPFVVLSGDRMHDLSVLTTAVDHGILAADNEYSTRLLPECLRFVSWSKGASVVNVRDIGSEGGQIRTLTHPGPIRQIGVTPNGDRISVIIARRTSDNYELWADVWELPSYGRMEERVPVGVEFGPVVSVDPNELKAKSARSLANVSLQDAAWATKGDNRCRAVISPNGKTVMTHGASRFCYHLWNAESGNPICTIGDFREGETGNRQMTDRKSVWAAEYTADGRHLVVGYGNGKGEIWDAEMGKKTDGDFSHENQIRQVYVCPGGNRFVTVGGDKSTREATAILWDTATAQSIGSPIRLSVSSAEFVALPASEQLVVLADGSPSGHVWRLSDGEVSDAISIPRGFADISHVVGNEKRQQFAFSTHDGHIAVYSFREGRWALEEMSLACNCKQLLFSPDGDSLICVGSDHRVRIWNTVAISADPRIIDAGSSIVSAECDRRGKRLLIATDKAATVWYIPTCNVVCEPLKDNSTITAAIFLPDGSGVLTGCEEGLVRVWLIGQSYEGSAETFREWVKVFTHSAIGDDGDVRPLERESWMQSRQAIVEIWNGLGGLSQ